jgi:hypothetical protein
MKSPRAMPSPPHPPYPQHQPCQLTKPDPENDPQFSPENDPDGKKWRAAERKWTEEHKAVEARNRQAREDYEKTTRPEYHRRWDPVVEQRDAEIKVTIATFPDRAWREVLAEPFRRAALAHYRFCHRARGVETQYEPPIIAGFLHEGEAAAIGAPLKTTKTLISIDLAAALVTATPFLGMDIPKPVPVWALTRETPSELWYELFEKAVRARGGDWGKAEELMMLSDDEDMFRLPDPTSKEDVREQKELHDNLEAYLCRAGVKVAILDPLYRIAPECNWSDLAAVGRMLDALLKPFTEAGTTPVVLAHFTKHASVGVWPTFDDLTGSGLAQYARAWLLLNRRTAYRFDQQHDLLALVGSSAGTGQQFSVHVNERDWSVTRVCDPTTNGKQPSPLTRKAGK